MQHEPPEVVQRTAGQVVQQQQARPEDLFDLRSGEDLQHVRPGEDLLDLRAREDVQHERAREDVQHERAREVVLGRHQEEARAEVRPMIRATDLPRLGAGAGYRAELSSLVRRGGAFACLELMPEHVLDAPPSDAEATLADVKPYPTITHAVSTSIGSAEGPNKAFLDGMRAVSDRVDAPWVSDHLCFTRTQGNDIGQLVPIPYTHEALDVVIRNVREVQRILGRPLALENVTRYFAYKNEDYTEPEFITKLVRETGCFVLLDVTNVDNNEKNLGWNADEYLRGMPMDAVIHLHLAGVHEHEGRILDTHAAPVPERVWRMIERVLERAPVRAIIIERDDELGDLDQLRGEVKRAQALMEKLA